MKKVSIVLFYSALFFFGCDAYYTQQFAKEDLENNISDNVHNLTSQEVKSCLAVADSQFGKNHIGFKGIYLSMSPKELDNIVQHSVLEYTFGENPKGGLNPKKKIDLSGENSLVFLKVYSCFYHICDSINDDQKNWGIIGCDGNNRCTYIDNISVQFVNSKISTIGLRSIGSSADEIESYLKGWATFVISAFSQKYGQPSVTFQNVDGFTILGFESGFTVYLCKWVINNEEIRIGFLESDSNFYGTIDFVDTEIEKTQNEDGKKVQVKF